MLQTLIKAQLYAAIQNTQHFNPLLLLFKALPHGQKDRVFFSGHLIYILKQERFGALGMAKS
jgi:hypothetical protein